MSLTSLEEVSLTIALKVRCAVLRSGQRMC